MCKSTMVINSHGFTLMRLCCLDNPAGGGVKWSCGLTSYYIAEGSFGGLRFIADTFVIKILTANPILNLLHV